MPFNLTAPYRPSGDQPQAIEQLTKGLKMGQTHQTLLGVTGSGKTFTMANVIKKVNRPTLILSHNKTLAAQLYEEFKAFFPENAVEYFVSYYDYYQPEAYLPTTGTYIEKDLSINEEIEKFRISCTSTLLSGRDDVIVVASVSCIYGIGNPENFKKGVVLIEIGQKMVRDVFLNLLVRGLYARVEFTPNRGEFRVRGDSVQIHLSYVSVMLTVEFWGDEIERIEVFSLENEQTKTMTNYDIYPANIFVTSPDTIGLAIEEIQNDLVEQMDVFENQGERTYGERLKERVEYDLEMIKELGYCSGIENYSRYFDRREKGSRPFCLLDYFPDDFLMMIDESHVTLPQVRAMWGGDFSRKLNLVDYGFRLPAAIDNRPLKFEEFEQMINKVVYVSATPSDYELEKSSGVVVEQLIRPTGVLDPIIEVRPCINQIDDLLDEIDRVIGKKQRVLVLTLTKKMAEDMDGYLRRINIKSTYIHSQVDTLDRVKILNQLKTGEIDVLVGINLLREGLDLPEVSLVAILDADKEGFLRSNSSLIQMVGRAARNIEGKVIMYADKETRSMKETIADNKRKRAVQIRYNEQNNITPQQIKTHQKSNVKSNHFYQKKSLPKVGKQEDLESRIKAEYKKMKEAVRREDFLEASRLRDEWKALKE